MAYEEAKTQSGPGRPARAGQTFAFDLCRPMADGVSRF